MCLLLFAALAHGYLLLLPLFLLCMFRSVSFPSFAMRQNESHVPERWLAFAIRMFVNYICNECVMFGFCGLDYNAKVAVAIAFAMCAHVCVFVTFTYHRTV